MLLVSMATSSIVELSNDDKRFEDTRSSLQSQKSLNKKTPQKKGRTAEQKKRENSGTKKKG